MIAGELSGLPIRKGPEPIRARDYCSARGAQALADKIKAYWHARVAEYEALGWIDCGFVGGHHGAHSRAMKWEREEEPREPEVFAESYEAYIVGGNPRCA